MSHAGRAHLPAVAAAVAVALAGSAWPLAAGPALGAEPAPSAVGGDPRSSGEGPGLVGDPLFAVAVVLAIAVLAIVATTLWVRLTGGSRDNDGGLGR